MTRTRPTDWISATAAAHRLGVTARTLRCYTADGKLPDVRGAGGRRTFLVSDLDALTSKRPQGKAIGYARVPAGQQASAELGRQVARLRAFAGDSDKTVFTGVASGVTDRRPSLHSALDACMEPDAGRLIVEHPDRLASSGTWITGHLLAGYGVTVTCARKAEDEIDEPELARDMLAVVSSLAGRLYGRQSARTRRLRTAVATETRGSGVA